MSKVTINGVDFELYYNLKAQRAISDRSGDLRNLTEWLNHENVAIQLERVTNVLTDLINGAVYKHNCEIALGMKQGEKRNFIEDDVLLCLINPHELGEYSEALWAAMGEGADFDDGGTSTDEQDPDLAAVPSETERKNDLSGVVMSPFA